MSAMTGFRPLIGKELREQWRTYRLPVVVVVFLTIGITSPALARYTKELIDLLGAQAAGGIQITLPEPTANDAVSQLIKNVGQFGILMAILLAMGTVASEKERGTAALILTKPASRFSFLLAKLVAIGSTLLVATVVACVFAWLYTMLLFEGSSPSLPGFVGMAVLVWLSILAYAALTFLGSTLTRSTAGGAGFGFVALIVLGVLSAIPVVGKWVPTALDAPAVNLALGLPIGDVVPALIGTLLIVGASFAIAWWSFSRQEL
jgi:ABC-2 type transport system permease protein